MKSRYDIVIKIIKYNFILIFWQLRYTIFIYMYTYLSVFTFIHCPPLCNIRTQIVYFTYDIILVYMPVFNIVLTNVAA